VSTPSRWHLLPSQPTAQRALVEALDVPPLVAQLLINRGITSVEAAAQYLHPALERLHDPLLLRDMPRAVARLQQALQRREHIIVFGDYDVDGVTATALVTLLLRAKGANVSSLLPHRLTDGYGLNEQLVQTARQQGARLVITVDCGTTATEEISALARAGIDTIILDHHLPRLDALPPAHTLINPRHPACRYPHKGLASVGLAFKLAQALCQQEPAHWQPYLDLVALGTVADVVPLLDENRILVKHGLAQLAQTPRVGLRSLMDVAGMREERLRPFHVGFILGPRINASGRLGSAERALQLLLTDSSVEADDLAEALNGQNRERQRLEQQVLSEAMREVEETVDFSQTRVLVVGKEGWHIGVVGIVAARLVDRYHRPSIVIGFDGERGRGSGRSIPAFHLTDALAQCASSLESFGGHAAACGLTLRRARLSALRETLNALARELLPPAALVPAVTIDAELPLAIWREPLFHALETLEPYGAGNPEPAFLSRRLIVKHPPQRVGRNHFKCWVTDGQLTGEAMGFRMAERIEELFEGAVVDCVYTPSLNRWDGTTTTLQLVLRDFRRAEC